MSVSLLCGCLARITSNKSIRDSIITKIEKIILSCLGFANLSP